MSRREIRYLLDGSAELDGTYLGTAAHDKKRPALTSVRGGRFRVLRGVKNVSLTASFACCQG